MSKKLDSLVDKIVDQMEGRIRKIFRQEFEYYLEDKGGGERIMHDKSSGSQEKSYENEQVKQRMSEAVQSNFNPKLSNHPSMAGGEDVADVRHGKNAQKYQSMVSKDYSNLID